MSARDPLFRLAAAASILPSYHDALGGEHHLTEETARVLLRAMGLAVDSAEAIAESLKTLEEAPWRRMLEPVTVMRSTGAARMRIRLTLPTSRAGDGLDWVFIGESGRQRRGTIVPAELPRLGARDLDGTTVERREFVLPFKPSAGYHRLTLQTRDGGQAGHQALIVAPARCYLPPRGPAGAGYWGIALQLYSLRSARNWGLGDFTDLAQMAAIGGRLGAATLALNPLHAMFPERPGHVSPYSPSHRQFLALHYLDVTAIADLAECASAQRLIEDRAFQERLAQLRTATLLDYAGVAELKRPVLEQLYASFRERHLTARPSSARGNEFRAYQDRNRGRGIERFGLFQALSEQFAGKSWRDWPEAFRDPGSPDCRAFAEQRRDRVEFFQYLQWQAELQLAKAADTARAAGMQIGVYRDLALAPDASGAEVWANQACIASGVSIGAPPDPWNPLGQSWGLPPYVPNVLRDAAYAPFSAVLRANMSEHGALRIDHALGLERLFWIPEGGRPQDGAYVRYPVDDLFAIVALESARKKCLVVGEDLGTLPAGFHDRMQAHGLLSYRLFYFSQDDQGEMQPPRRYPSLSAVAVSTHDLATLAGYWSGGDLELRGELRLFPSTDSEIAARTRRIADRQAIIRALKKQRLVPASTPDNVAELSLDLVEAIHRFLARTPALLLLVSLEDILGDEQQVNLPGTVDTHPNWRRKTLLPLEEIEDDPRTRALIRAIAAERGRRDQAAAPAAAP